MLPVDGICVTCGRYLCYLWKVFVLPVDGICVTCGRYLCYLWKVFVLPVEGICVTCAGVASASVPSRTVTGVAPLRVVCVTCGRYLCYLYRYVCYLWTVFVLPVDSICVTCGRYLCYLCRCCQCQCTQPDSNRCSSPPCCYKRTGSCSNRNPSIRSHLKKKHNSNTVIIKISGTIKIKIH